MVPDIAIQLISTRLVYLLLVLLMTSISLITVSFAVLTKYQKSYESSVKIHNFLVIYCGQQEASWNQESVIIPFYISNLIILENLISIQNYTQQ